MCRPTAKALLTRLMVCASVPMRPFQWQPPPGYFASQSQRQPRHDLSNMPPKGIAQ